MHIGLWAFCQLHSSAATKCIQSRELHREAANDAVLTRSFLYATRVDDI